VPFVDVFQFEGERIRSGFHGTIEDECRNEEEKANVYLLINKYNHIQ
jgi:hypothetical protein